MIDYIYAADDVEYSCCFLEIWWLITTSSEWKKIKCKAIPMRNALSPRINLVQPPEKSHATVWLWAAKKTLCNGSPFRWFVQWEDQLKKLPIFHVSVDSLWLVPWKHPTYEFVPPNKLQKHGVCKKRWVSKFGKLKGLLWPGILDGFRFPPEMTPPSNVSKEREKVP